MAKRSISRRRSSARPGSRGRSGSALRFRGPFTALGTLLLWTLVLVVPLVIAPTAADTFRLPKRMLAEWLGLASLLAFALAAAFTRPRVEHTEGSARRIGAERGWVEGWGRALPAIAPMVLVATLGLAFTSHPLHVREGLADLWIGAACLVGWSLALSSRRLERLVAGLAVPGVLLAAVGILQFHDIYRPFGFTGGEEAWREGVSSLAGNTGDLAGFLVLPVLVAQWRLAAPGAGRPWRIAWGAVLAVCLYGVAVTQTLTAVAAVLAGSVLLWGVRLPWRRALAAGAAVVALVAVTVLLVTPLRARVGVAFDNLREARIDAVLSGRLDGWRAALWMVEEHPVVGVGHGAYRAEFAPAKLALLDEGAELYEGHLDPFFANAHNDLLEAGAEWGMLGLLALGWGLWVLGRSVAAGAWRRPVHDRAFALAVLAALTVLAVGQFPFRVALIAFPALLVLAWIFRAADEEAPGGPERVAGRRWLAWGAVVVLALAVVWQTDRWKERVGASKRIRVVEAMMGRLASAGGEVPSRVTGANLRLLREAGRSAPAQVEVPAGIAGQYLVSGQAGRAAEAYLEALELEPRPELYLNLARARLKSGDRDGAIEAFRSAVRLNPRLRDEIPPTMRREVGR